MKSIDKDRYTLVPSRDTEGKKMWAKVVPIQRANALDCTGCAFITDGDNCVIAPPCHNSTRFDERDVIFVTAVEQW
jgi:recombinational DNA repair protein RecR